MIGRMPSSVRVRAVMSEQTITPAGARRSRGAGRIRRE